MTLVQVIHPDGAPMIEIFRLEYFELKQSDYIANIGIPIVQRWIVYSPEVEQIGVEQALELGTCLVVACEHSNLDATCEALAAIASRPQSITVGIDVADLYSVTGAINGLPAIGKAVVFDGLIHTAPRAFWAQHMAVGKAGLLVQLANTNDSSPDDLGQLALATLNWQGVERALYTRKDNARRTSAILLAFD